MNLNEMLKQAKKIQGEMQAKEKEIESREFVIEKQGIKLVMTGNRKIKSLDINPALIDPEDAEMLQDLIIITFNEAMSKIDEAHQEVNDLIPNGTLPF